MPKKPKLSPRSIVFRRTLFVGVLLFAGAGIMLQILRTNPVALVTDALNRAVLADIYKDFGVLTPQIRTLEDDQTKSGITVVDDQTIQNQITPVYYHAEQGDVAGARKALIALQNDYLMWRGEYDAKVRQNAGKSSPLPLVATHVTGGLTVPILMYHKTPPDFDKQLQYLQNHGYITITPHTLVAALHSQSSMPSKPLIITFDDGFADQMNAFALLQKHNMKATFYIINGGPASNWCIGANRHEGQPCGDAYLSWDQIRQLDSSGLITIAGHTIDHSNLPTLPADQQRHEIADSKTEIEQQIGHQILDFAYPYGSYNATTIQLVKEAGFESAVSTVPGTVQSLNNLYALYRVRQAFMLP